MAALDNPKHEAFAQAIAKGCRNREAYTGAGYRVKSDAVADAAAARLLADVRVASRVRELQAASAEEAIVTAVDLSEQLEEIRVKALAAGQMGAAAQAVMGRAKLHGLIIDKAEVKDVTPPLPAEQRQAEIHRLLKKRPDLRVV
jgi:phage terminase small subunit